MGLNTRIVGVGEQADTVVAAECAQRFQTVNGNSDQELVEGIVDLRVGEVRIAEEGAYAAVKLVGTDLA